MATTTIAVRAVAPKDYGLVHPAGFTLSETGQGNWVADSFTFALIRDGTFERLDAVVAPPPVYAPTLRETYYYLRDGLYVAIAPSALAPVLAPWLDGTAPPADTTAPTITVSPSQTVAENTAFSLTLTANEIVTWAKTGGADAGLFTLTGAVLSMTAKDFESPADANGDNAYVVTVTATDAAGNASTLTITVTVTDVAEGGGTLDFSNPANSGLHPAI